MDSSVYTKERFHSVGGVFAGKREYLEMDGIIYK